MNSSNNNSDLRNNNNSNVNSSNNNSYMSISNNKNNVNSEINNNCSYMSINNSNNTDMSSHSNNNSDLSNNNATEDACTDCYNYGTLRHKQFQWMISQNVNEPHSSPSRYISVTLAAAPNDVKMGSSENVASFEMFNWFSLFATHDEQTSR